MLIYRIHLGYLCVITENPIQRFSKFAPTNKHICWFNENNFSYQIRWKLDTQDEILNYIHYYIYTTEDIALLFKLIFGNNRCIKILRIREKVCIAH